MGWEYHNRKRTVYGTWADQKKRERIGIRVTNAERELIQGRAYARSQSMTEYIMNLIHADLHGPTWPTEPVSGACTPTVLYPQAPVDKRRLGAVKGPRRPCAALDSGNVYN